MCKSKIHRATVTEANLNYQGSITIDSDLLRAADILEHEKVHILNLNNAHRAETYAISGPAGSGVVCLNGAAARLAIPGDTIIIISYCLLDDLESHKHKPKMIRVDEKNRIIH